MSKADLLLESLTRFYDDPAHSARLHDILTTKSQGISLRNLEWFITNYAKNRHVTYTSPMGRAFTVHVAYKSSLDGYSKKLFDPFCRTERIQFQGLTTTVAQLNFIKWCLTNGIIDYMQNAGPFKDKTCGQSRPGTPESSTHSKIDTMSIA
jgi:hypothetical protein